MSDDVFDREIITALATVEPPSQAIATRAEFDLMTERQVYLRELDKRVVEFFKEPKAAAHAAHKAITSRESAIRKRIADTLKPIDDAARRFLKAERDREAAVRAQALRAQQAAIEQAQQAALDAAIDSGDIASVLGGALDEAVAVPESAPVAVSEVASASLGASATWVLTVVDKMRLVRAVVDGVVPEDVLTINEAAIRRYARDVGGRIAWPGITWTEDINFRSRRS